MCKADLQCPGSVHRRYRVDANYVIIAFAEIPWKLPNLRQRNYAALHRQLTTCSDDAALSYLLTSHKIPLDAVSCSLESPPPPSLWSILVRLRLPFRSSHPRSRSQCLSAVLSARDCYSHRRSFCGERHLDVDASCSYKVQRAQISRKVCYPTIWSLQCLSRRAES